MHTSREITVHFHVDTSGARNSIARLMAAIDETEVAELARLVESGELGLRDALRRAIAFGRPEEERRQLEAALADQNGGDQEPLMQR